MPRHRPSRPAPRRDLDSPEKRDRETGSRTMKYLDSAPTAAAIAMLTSTVTAQPSPQKKSSLVGPRLRNRFPAPAPKNRALPRRAHRHITGTRRAQPHRAATRSAALSRDGHGGAATPCGISPATAARRGGTQRRCQPWGHSGGHSASSSGIRLRRIPQCHASPQHTAPSGGSTGIPDSLDTKQVITSGPAALSRQFDTRSRGPASITGSRPAFSYPFTAYFDINDCIRGSVARHPGNSRSASPPLAWTNISREFIRPPENPPKNSRIRAGVAIARGAEWSYVCCVTGKTGNHTEPPPRGSPRSPGKPQNHHSGLGTAMCYADTAINDDGTATAFCYCGWNQECADLATAEAAAEAHQNAADATD